MHEKSAENIGFHAAPQHNYCAAKDAVNIQINMAISRYNL